MKKLKTPVPLLVAVLCAAATITAAKPVQANGYVQSYATIPASGTYYGYLFITGSSTPYARIGPFNVQGGGYNFSFPNIPYGHRYFIRVMEASSEGGNYGGQCPDQYFQSGNMTLHNTEVVDNWYPDGTQVP